MFNRRLIDEPRSKATILLLVVIYLGIFTAHDLIFLSGEPLPGEAGKDETPSYSQGQPQVVSIIAVNDHICPFCSGFVDDHAVVEFSDSSSEIAILNSTPEEVVTRFIPSFNNPRDPPSLFI